MRGCGGASDLHTAIFHRSSIVLRGGQLDHACLPLSDLLAATRACTSLLARGLLNVLVRSGREKAIRRRAEDPAPSGESLKERQRLSAQACRLERERQLQRSLQRKRDQRQTNGAVGVDSAGRGERDHATEQESDREGELELDLDQRGGAQGTLDLAIAGAACLSFIDVCQCLEGLSWAGVR